MPCRQFAQTVICLQTPLRFQESIALPLEKPRVKALYRSAKLCLTQRGVELQQFSLQKSTTSSRAATLARRLLLWPARTLFFADEMQSLWFSLLDRLQLMDSPPAAPRAARPLFDLAGPLVPGPGAPSTLEHLQVFDPGPDLSDAVSTSRAQLGSRLAFALVVLLCPI